MKKRYYLLIAIIFITLFVMGIKEVERGSERTRQQLISEGLLEDPNTIDKVDYAMLAAINGRKSADTDAEHEYAEVYKHALELGYRNDYEEALDVLKDIPFWYRKTALHTFRFTKAIEGYPEKKINWDDEEFDGVLDWDAVLWFNQSDQRPLQEFEDGTRREIALDNQGEAVLEVN